MSEETMSDCATKGNECIAPEGCNSKKEKSPYEVDILWQDHNYCKTKLRFVHLRDHSYYCAYFRKYKIFDTKKVKIVKQDTSLKHDEDNHMQGLEQSEHVKYKEVQQDHSRDHSSVKYKEVQQDHSRDHSYYYAYCVVTEKIAGTTKVVKVIKQKEILPHKDTALDLAKGKGNDEIITILETSHGLEQPEDVEHTCKGELKSIRKGRVTYLQCPHRFPVGWMDAHEKCRLCRTCSKSNPCEVCSKWTTEWDRFEKKEKTFHCDQCQNKYVYKKLLDQHYEIHKPDGKVFTCDKCAMKFPFKTALALHFRIHADVKREPVVRDGTLEPKQFQCKECRKCFSKIKYLRGHMLCHKPKVKQHLCDICGMKFAFPHKLRKHMITHSNVLPYMCEKCGKGFRSRINLKVHMARHNSDLNRFTCDVCGKKFVENNLLTRHHKTFHTEPKFKCDQCGKAFKIRRDLMRHVSIHSDEKPYACDKCSAVFRLESLLKKHYKIHHSNVKPFRCSICFKAFSLAYSLKNHYMVHTGMKLFVCEKCGKAFNNPVTFKSHCRLHSGDRLKCKICGKTYRHPWSLTLHKKVHADESG